MTTYFAQPTATGNFSLFTEGGNRQSVKTLKLARAIAEFAGAALIVLDKNGKPRN